MTYKEKKKEELKDECKLINLRLADLTQEERVEIFEILTKDYCSKCGWPIMNGTMCGSCGNK